MYNIYLVVNTKNQKGYIGFTTESIEARWTKHQSNAKRRAKTYLHKAIKKNSHEGFALTLLKRGEDEEWGLKVEEPYYIAMYRTNDPKWGYNLTCGGDGILGYKHTEITKNKLMGNKNCLGKQNALGYKRTDEWCKNQSNRLLGVPHSKDWVANISIALQGNQNCKGKQNALGHKHTQEQNAAKSARQKGIKSKTLLCPHCGVTGGIAPMHRWHFDNCKKKVGA